VLGAGIVVAQAVALLVGELDHPVGGLREPLEHSGLPPDRNSPPPAYLLCTACLLTPSLPAMSCQVHHLARALSTCRASRTSTSARNAATAASPTWGSLLPLAAANFVA
jgi:hypothetical protein